MNLRKKTMLASGLGALAAAVWVPALAELGSAPEAPPTEAPAEAPAEEPEGAPSAAAATARDEAEPGDEPGAPTAVADSGDLAQLDGLEERTAALAGPQANDDLAALLAALAGPLGSVGKDTEPERMPFELEVNARLELADFAAANAVNGVIHGPGGSVALLGHRVVREGELLPGGRIRVARIGPSELELTAGDELLVLALPAIQARAAVPRGSGPSAADLAQPGAPAPAAASASPNPSPAPQPSTGAKGGGA